MTPPRGRRALEAVSFFVADFQAGIGPFLGIFLAMHGWDNAAIGGVMTLGGGVGMLMTAPAGAWVDATPANARWSQVPPF